MAPAFLSDFEYICILGSKIFYAKKIIKRLVSLEGLPPLFFGYTRE
jgi:hypothetical protein